MSIIGFSCLNWSPSKVLAGQYFSWCSFAIFVLQASSWSQALSLLLVATPLLGDACICVCRFFLGQPVFIPHRLHLFQRCQRRLMVSFRVTNLISLPLCSCDCPAFRRLLVVTCVAFALLLLGFGWTECCFASLRYQ